MSAHGLLLEIERLVKQALADALNLKEAQTAMISAVNLKSGIDAKTVNGGNLKMLVDQKRQDFDESGIGDHFMSILTSFSDPTGALDADERAAELAKMVEQMDPVVRGYLFEQPGIDSAGMAKLLKKCEQSALTKIASELVAVQPPSTMENILDQMLEQELDGCVDMTTFLRSKVAATQVLSAYTNESPQGKQFAQENIDNTFATVTPVPLGKDQPHLNLELELNKLKRQFRDKNLTEVPPEVLEKFQEVDKGALVGLLDTTIANDAARMMAKLYDKSVARFQKEQENNPDPNARSPEEEALRLVGGHVLLRMVIPQINIASAKKLKNKEITRDQMRAVTLVTKALQSISNGVVPRNDDIAKAFGPLMKNDDGGASALSDLMQGHLKKIVEQGKNAPGPGDEMPDVKSGAKLSGDLTTAAWDDFSKQLGKKDQDANKDVLQAVASVLDEAQTSAAELENNLFKIEAWNDMAKDLTRVLNSLGSFKSDDKMVMTQIAKMQTAIRAYAFNFNDRLIDWVAKVGGSNLYKSADGMQLMKDLCDAQAASEVH